MSPIDAHYQYLMRRQPLLDKIDDPFTQGRFLGIGGSDAPVIMNQSRFKTPMELFHEKTFRQPLADLSDNAAVQWGHIHEPTLRNHFQQLHRCTVETFVVPFIHADYPWIRANIDGLLPNNIILEIKTAGAMGHNKWGQPDQQIPADDADNIPLDYLIQIHLYMATCHAKKAVLIVLIGVCDYREYHIPFNEKFAKDILDQCNTFWCDHIMKDIAPNASTLNDLKLEFPNPIPHSTLNTDESTQIWLDIYLEAKETEKTAMQAAKSAQIEIARFLGDNETLADPTGTPLLTYKSQTSQRINTKALRKDHPHLAKIYSTITHSRTMRIPNDATGRPLQRHKKTRRITEADESEERPIQRL